MSSRKAAPRSAKTAAGKTSAGKTSAAKPSAGRAAAKPRKRAAPARAAAAVRQSEPAIEGSLDAEAVRLAAAIDQALAQGRLDRLSGPALQGLIAALCRIYRLQVDAGADYLPLATRLSVPPTDVMVMSGSLLRAADLQVFELGMWQSFTGR